MTGRPVYAPKNSDNVGRFRCCSVVGCAMSCDQSSKNHSIRRVAAAFVLSAIIGLSVTACDASQSIQLELATFQQIKHNLSRLASTVLEQVRLHSGGTRLMTTAPTPTVAQSAAAFDQSIGVNVHMAYTWSPYANVTAVENDLAYLGVNHVRDELFDASNVQINYEELAAAG